MDQVVKRRHPHKNVYEQIACEDCQMKDLVEHVVVSKMTGADPIEVINRTSYPPRVKARAILEVTSEANDDVA